MKPLHIKKIVRESYGRIAREQKGCGCGTCGPDAKEFAKGIGYSVKELSAAPDDANLGLGCGNPAALAGLKKGETVLDLGAGAGFDCFIAAKSVGKTGKVIGVDMTPEMIEKARENARKGKFSNVDFRLGEIENLPVEDNSVNVVISNCVINLSPDKGRVFREVRRALKRGGRIAISDIALRKALPLKMRKSIEAYVGCVGGAVLIDEYKRSVESAGFKDVKLTVKETSACIAADTNDPIGRALMDGLGRGESLEDYIVSVYVEGRK
ncbi:MAG: methyltransferase domain-containing protein [Nitrospiraceae bacterium]|nr:MAG: methyltransferase domain-containing protein [Nitrospiraceae bacterium]